MTKLSKPVIVAEIKTAKTKGPTILTKIRKNTVRLALPKSQTTTIRLTPEAREALDKEAARLRRTRSWIVQELVAEWLASRAKPRKPKVLK